MTNEYRINCTGDVVTGDTIKFTEAVFGGSHRKPKFLGERTIEADVLRDSYGAGKQQHTFSLRVLASTGLDPLTVGSETRRKARNVYRNGCWRVPWASQLDRLEILAEKHLRGGYARAIRADRLAGEQCL